MAATEVAKMICTQCKKLKMITEFYKEHGKPRNPCKKCKYLSVKRWRQMRDISVEI